MCVDVVSIIHICVSYYCTIEPCTHSVYHVYYVVHMHTVLVMQILLPGSAQVFMCICELKLPNTVKTGKRYYGLAVA